MNSWRLSTVEMDSVQLLMEFVQTIAYVGNQLWIILYRKHALQFQSIRRLKSCYEKQSDMHPWLKKQTAGIVDF